MWVRSFSVFSWIFAGLLGGVTFIVLAAAGLGAGLAVVGWIALVTGFYVLITGRRSWVRIAGRRLGAFVLASGLALTIVGGTIGGPAHPQIEAVAHPAPSATTSSPSPTPTPTVDPAAEPDAPDNVEAAGDKPTVQVVNSSVTKTSALALLATLQIKGSAPKTGYDRVGDFGSAWLDVDRNGCDTRNDILFRDLHPTTKSGVCKVLSGTLNDPYTGRRIDFVRGTTTSLAVQIDHVVALMDAWETGAQQLTQAQRITLANDPMNLFAVDGSTNEQKSDGDAATWLPPSKGFRCTYVAHQVSVKATYGLWVTPAEHDAIERVLSDCPNEPAVTSVFAPAPALALSRIRPPRQPPLRRLRPRLHPLRRLHPLLHPLPASITRTALQSERPGPRPCTSASQAIRANSTVTATESPANRSCQRSCGSSSGTATIQVCALSEISSLTVESVAG